MTKNVRSLALVLVVLLAGVALAGCNQRQSATSGGSVTPPVIQQEVRDEVEIQQNIQEAASEQDAIDQTLETLEADFSEMEDAALLQETNDLELAE